MVIDREHSIDVSVVIPAFNEALCITEAVRSSEESFSSAGHRVEIIVVDDGSVDATGDLARGAGARVYRTAHNGKGSALRLGIKVSRGTQVVFCDADLPILPYDLTQLVGAAKNSGTDVCVGRRSGRRALTLRSAAGRTYAAMWRLVVCSDTTDPQSPAKVLSGRAARDLATMCSEDGYGFDSELIAHARRLGLSISEVDVQWKDLRARLRTFAVLRLSLIHAGKLLRYRRILATGRVLD